MLDDLNEDDVYRVRMSGRALMALAEVLRLQIEADTESATKERHPDDVARYHTALSSQHEAMAAMLHAEEEDE